MQAADEGVVKFDARHTFGRLPVAADDPRLTALLAWREVMYRLGVVGQDPTRYGGAGYGNVSARLGPFPGRPGERPFLVSGTQTGGRVTLQSSDFCVVRRWAVTLNQVESEGPVVPSSESMTHGAIYDLGPEIRFVLHAHCPEVWGTAKQLRVPTTAPSVDYGTPEMAREMKRLDQVCGLREQRLLAMAGHEDGVIAFGRTAEEAGATLTSALARALALTGSYRIE
jgi:ribulose-5-phosphate 4-epimerase/fuculose-1-phosphate aldolase